jgi:hypothetical protein
LLGNPRTYGSLAYLFLSFPLGLGYFVAIVTLVATGAGLLVTLAGIPLLIFTMFGWCALAAIDVQVTNFLVGRRIEPIPFNWEPGRGWQARLIARAKAPLTWRSLAFLLYRSIEGLATFVIAVTVISVAAFMVGTPLWYGLDRAGVAEFDGLFVDSYPLAALVSAGGVVLLALSIAGARGLALLSTAIGGAILGSSRPVSKAAPLAPVTAALAPAAAALEPAAEDAPAVASPTAPEDAWAEATLQAGSLTLNPLTHVVSLAGDEVAVTPKEFDLLHLFLANPGRAFHRDELIERIWEGDLEMTDRTIDTHIQRLRRKLGSEAQRIQTVRGVGYKLDPADRPAPAANGGGGPGW